MQIMLMPIENLKPYERNPRKNEKAVDVLVKSIREFGFKQPIVIDKHNVIIIGHTRLLAAKKLRLEKVPVLIASDLTDDQAKALRIMDNKSHEFSIWDYDLLKNEIANLDYESYDLDLTGFSSDEIEKIMGKPESEAAPGEEYAPVLEVAVTCEDEADQEAVFKLMTSKGYKCRILTI